MTAFGFEEYLEPAVRDVLTAGEDRVDATACHAALLLASSGFAGQADRLVSRWLELTGHPVTALTADPVHARAWAMWQEARGVRPEWAEALTPLDLDAEEAAHRKYLNRREPAVPAGLLGDSDAARIVSGLAGQLDGGTPPDPLRVAAAEAESLARQGKDPADALNRWAEQAVRRPRPEVAALLACRHLAPLLTAGANPLGLSAEQAGRCTGDLIAALRRRYPATERLDWPDLLHRILELRGGGHLCPPADEGRLRAVQRRLGERLPEDYLAFLRTSDGLPPDVVFPRLLGAGELRATETGVLVLSEARDTGEAPVITLTKAGTRWLTVEWDAALGSTVHPTFRHLLERHLALLGS
ncbi:SMI1/KNR4 family protein [Amycolatopsis nigrescens]|uniref:SMI1/KNR4 family protein n=1 Tax=Amycolatopsis nigrescens TaxID=381445 RepID=UPI000362C8EA|nr:SMI1/KNR4 family protein [Amycolatopsis nigrescens]